MNASQRHILVAAAVIVVAMLLFPPFHDVAANGAEAHVGYFPLFAPPGWDNGLHYPVNLGLLGMQWIGALVVAGLLWLRAKG